MSTKVSHGASKHKVMREKVRPPKACRSLRLQQLSKKAPSPQWEGTTLSGDGSPLNPFTRSVSTVPNTSGCYFCASKICSCEFLSDTLEAAFDSCHRKRITETPRRSECAKSILPPFVARLIEILDIKESDTFYDFGCGNGSVLFQVAHQTGARCVGIELSAHNAQVARDAWAAVRPTLEEHRRGKKQLPEMHIITGDIADYITNPSSSISIQKKEKDSNICIWTANLLMPRSMTQFMSEVFRSFPVGTRIAAFDDLYPHARLVSRTRDPEAFELFEMFDYRWQPQTVEWCCSEGPFYAYVRV